MYDQRGQQVWAAKYDVYGKAYEAQDTYVHCHFRAPGQYEDAESGLYYNRFRYYNPETGVYISQYPIGLQGGFEPYAYVHDPLTWIDPDGTSGFGSGKGQHEAIVRVVDDATGKTVHKERVLSGNMTPEEKALGFPQSTLATHTEARAVKNIPLEKGQTMVITGKYPPCLSCRGKMNAKAASSGGNVKYQWREDGQTKRWKAKCPKK